MTDSKMNIRLSDDRRSEIVNMLKAHYSDEFDEELSPFRAENILDFFIRSLGPSVYNQALEDARSFLMERIEDLDATFHKHEEI